MLSQAKHEAVGAPLGNIVKSLNFIAATDGF